MRTGEIIVDFSKAFSSVPHDRLLMEMAATGVYLRGVVWVKEFVLGRSKRVREDGQLSEEFRVNSGLRQRSVLGPVLFVAYVNVIWKTMNLVYGCSQMVV